MIQKIKEQNGKLTEYSTPEEYLKRSLDFLIRTHAGAMKALQDTKKEIKDLEEDLSKIKSPKLIQACESVLAELKKGKKMHLTKIKACNEDIHQVKAIMKRLK